MNQLNEALETCLKAIDLDLDYAVSWQTKGEILEAMGNHEDAAKAYEKAKGLGYNSD